MVEQGFKDVFRILATISLLASFALIFAGVFIMEKGSGFPWDSLARFLGVALMVLGMIFTALGGKKAPDERELKASALANQWGILALLVYIVILSLFAKTYPQYVSVPLALWGAFLSLILAGGTAFQVLKRLPISG